MDLEFSEEEAELRDNVRSVLAGICPLAVVRSVYEGKGPPAAVWQKMVELDWPGLAIDEHHGGVGLGFLELALVSEELGRAVVPSPLLATATQFAPAVRELGDDAGRDRFLPPVAAGECCGTVAYAEGGRWHPDAVRAVAQPADDGWVLDGVKDSVVDGATADEIVVIAAARPVSVRSWFRAATSRCLPRTVIDPSMPVADVRLEAVPVPADRVLAAPGTPGVEVQLERATQEATVAMATATTGACRRIFEMTLEYAKERVQYDRPIGSFQALKHRLADMYLSLERATALCYFAALSIAEDDPRRAGAASAAKVGAGDCQRLLVGEGLQLHGGIGFTWEYDLQFLLKRAKSGDALYGNSIAHRAALAQMLGLAPTAEETMA